MSKNEIEWLFIQDNTFLSCQGQRKNVGLWQSKM